MRNATARARQRTRRPTVVSVGEKLAERANLSSRRRYEPFRVEMRAIGAQKIVRPIGEIRRHRRLNLSRPAGRRVPGRMRRASRHARSCERRKLRSSLIGYGSAPSVSLGADDIARSRDIFTQPRLTARATLSRSQRDTIGTCRRTARRCFYSRFFDCQLARHKVDCHFDS